MGPLIQRPTFRDLLLRCWLRSVGTLSLLLVGVCVGLFVIITLLDLLRIVPRDISVSYLGFSYLGAIRRGLIYQWLTAPLMHANISHLLFNMLALWMLGPEVELILGRWRYILFSALCGFAGLAGFLLFHQGDGQIALGYSGVIFGLFVAQAWYFPNTPLMFFAFFPVKMKYAVLMMAMIELYLVYTPGRGGIANIAHLLGAVAALVFLATNRWWFARRARVMRIPQNRVKIPRRL